MSRKLLNWANSQTIGGVSEIAVMAPIKRGLVPGEHRTFEERLRFTIDNLADRVRKGIPTELDKVTTIHFGRMIIVRPEQYLVYSAVPGIAYEGGTAPEMQIPKPIDDYCEIDPSTPDPPPSGNAADKPEFRSWLLTLVEFDGDLRAYFRDVAQFLASDFDSVFRNCDDFPSTQDFEAFWAWIRRYQIETHLFYPRYRDLSVVRIKQLEDFKRRFDAFVARVRPSNGRRVTSMDDLFDEFLTKTQQYARDFPAPGGTYAPGED